MITLKMVGQSRKIICEGCGKPHYIITRQLRIGPEKSAPNYALHFNICVNCWTELGYQLVPKPEPTEHIRDE